MNSNIFVKIKKRIWPAKNKLDPGVIKSRSWGDRITFSFSLLCLCIVCFLQFFIVFWMCYSAFKDDIDMFIDMFALPKWGALHWENFTNVLKIIRVENYVEGQGYVSFGLPVLLKNSILISLLMPIQGSIVGTLCAYILAKYRFVGRGLLLKINFFMIVCPISASLAANLRLNHIIGRYDNFLMMLVTGAHPFAGMGLLIQMSFYSAIPQEMSEAASIDGAGHFVIFARIHFPLVFPTVFIYYIIAVFGGWNDYQTSLIWLPSMPTVALGLYQFQYDSAKYAATLPQVLAAFVLMSIPSTIFYLCNQKLIASKMVMAGLKG